MGLHRNITLRFQIRTNQIQILAVKTEKERNMLFVSTIQSTVRTQGYTYVITNPLPEIAGEDEVTWERVGESCVELQHLQQSFSLDHMQVTVSQRPHIGTRMSKRGLFPENIAEHITLTCEHGQIDKGVKKTHKRLYVQSWQGWLYKCNWI